MAEGRTIEPTVSYSDDKKDPDNYVRIVVDIPGLKKQWCGSEASNGTVDLDNTESSFTLTVEVEGQTYQYPKKPQQLVHNITGATYEVSTGEVVVKLHKAKPGSWAGELSSMGLFQ